MNRIWSEDVAPNIEKEPLFIFFNTWKYSQFDLNEQLTLSLFSEIIAAHGANYFGFSEILGLSQDLQKYREANKKPLALVIHMS
ncbi:hypothetical protein [Arcanobacterium haemolyticum]|uniref:hypothetical protein n=1 Tax=Arcanobacterium haemolyticum TaxID=28264 RepID=UPI00059FD8AC|nr:hypothetical protein [Arcanobacterium haemolyticum]SQH28216.1 Uncharacterised protein [Arcanobacterium haemolyticum]